MNEEIKRVIDAFDEKLIHTERSLKLQLENVKKVREESETLKQEFYDFYDKAKKENQEEIEKVEQIVKIRDTLYTSRDEIELDINGIKEKLEQDLVDKINAEQKKLETKLDELLNSISISENEKEIKKSEIPIVNMDFVNQIKKPVTDNSVTLMEYIQENDISLSESEFRDIDSLSVFNVPIDKVFSVFNISDSKSLESVLKDQSNYFLLANIAMDYNSKLN